MAMLYSKRRKNLGGGRRKRSNRKSNKTHMWGGMLPQWLNYRNNGNSLPVAKQHVEEKTQKPSDEMLEKIVIKLNTNSIKYKQDPSKFDDVIKKDILDVMGPVKDDELPIVFDFFSNIDTVFKKLPNGIIKEALYDIANRHVKIIQGKY